MPKSPSAPAELQGSAFGKPPSVPACPLSSRDFPGAPPPPAPDVPSEAPAARSPRPAWSGVSSALQP